MFNAVGQFFSVVFHRMLYLPRRGRTKHDAPQAQHQGCPRQRLAGEGAARAHGVPGGLPPFMPGSSPLLEPLSLRSRHLMAAYLGGLLLLVITLLSMVVRSGTQCTLFRVFS